MTTQRINQCSLLTSLKTCKDTSNSTTDKTDQQNDTKKALRQINIAKNGIVTIKKTVSLPLQTKIAEQQMQRLFKNLSSQYCHQYISDIVSYMLANEQKHYNLVTAEQQLALCRKISKSSDIFTQYIEAIVKMCKSYGLKNSIFSACYYFYTMMIFKDWDLEQIQHIIIACLLTSSKYYEIYPPFLQQFLTQFNPTLNEHRIIDYELEILERLNFQYFYMDHEGNWLSIFTTILDWTGSYLTVSKNILQLGLGNMKLHSYKPSIKAYAAISIVKKNLCNEIKLDLCKIISKINENEAREAQKQYIKVLHFNNKNQILNDRKAQIYMKIILRKTSNF